MKKYIYVGIGGVIGSLLRYGISLSIDLSSHFPWETLFVNVTGAFLLSYILLGQFLRKEGSADLHRALTVGLLGSYTTFSTVILETTLLLETNLSLAFLYTLVSVLLSLLACFLAYIIRKKEPKT